MLVNQVYLNCLSQASYFVADEERKVAAVIDPRRDIDAYLELASKHNTTIEHIILTHFHADFVSGHLELAAATGASIYLGSEANAEFPFRMLCDGDSVKIGDLKLEILETPGHTTESVCLVLFDKRSTAPHAVFTGDTLFVGDVGRPDLMGGDGFSSEYLASMLFDSLKKLRALPNATIVYPAHGPGSLCGKQLGQETHSTIGHERLFNQAFKSDNKEAFVETLCADMPSAPAYFSHDAAMNRSNHTLLPEVLETSTVAIALDELLSIASDDVQFLDVRDADDFAAGHLRNAVCVPLNGRFAASVGSLLSSAKPLYVLCNSGQENEAALRLARVGFEARGFFSYDSHWDQLAAQGLVRSCVRVSASELRSVFASRSVQVIDVRNCNEWDSGHIPGSINVPLFDLTRRLGTIPNDQDVVVHCQGGYRSAIAMSLLLNAGYTNCRELTGGFLSWEQQAAPNEISVSPACSLVPR